MTDRTHVAIGILIVIAVIVAAVGSTVHQRSEAEALKASGAQLLASLNEKQRQRELDALLAKSAEQLATDAREADDKQAAAEAERELHATRLAMEDKSSRRCAAAVRKKWPYLEPVEVSPVTGWTMPEVKIVMSVRLADSFRKDLVGIVQCEDPPYLAYGEPRLEKLRL